MGDGGEFAPTLKFLIAKTLGEDAPNAGNERGASGQDNAIDLRRIDPFYVKTGSPNWQGAKLSGYVARSIELPVRDAGNSSQ